jgi:hypothetical protein
MSDEKINEKNAVRYMTVDEIVSIVCFVANHTTEAEKPGALGTAETLRSIANDRAKVAGLFRSLPDMTKAEDDKGPHVAIATMFYHALERLNYGTPNMANAVDTDIAEEHMKKAAAVALFRSGYKAGEEKPNKHCWAAVRALAAGLPVPGEPIAPAPLPAGGEPAAELGPASDPVAG